MIKKSEFVLIIIILIIFVFVAYQINIIYQLYNNTLENNSNWRSLKSLSAYNLMGAQEFYQTRNALVKKSLNLGAWFGNQYLIYKKKLDIYQIDFDFSINPDSCLTVIFNKDEKNFNGIRISRHPLFSQIYFQADDLGKFNLKRRLRLNDQMVTNIWNHAKILLDREKEQVAFFINNNPVGKFILKQKPLQEFGFRGSADQVLVDNVIVRNKDAKILFKDHFNYSKKKIIPSLIIIIFIIITLILFVIIRLFMKFEFKSSLFWLLLIVLSLLLTVTPLYAYIQWKFSRYPPGAFSNRYDEKRAYLKDLNRIKKDQSLDTKNTEQEQSSDIMKNSEHDQQEGNILKVSESEDEEIFIKPDDGFRDQYIEWLWNQAQEMLDRLDEDYDQTTDNQTIRIAFIGTSQTWGSGAMTVEETEVKVIEKKLNAHFQDQYNIECLNCAVQGMVSFQLLEIYKNKILSYHPDINVIILSNNDFWSVYNKSLYYQTLERFYLINKKNNIKTLFVHEPNSVEQSPEGIKGLTEMHEIMSKVGLKYNILVIPLHQYMNKYYDYGFIWWDFVHMTSLGQKIAGEYLADNLITLIENKKKQ
ncbi:MAG: SGNH/GDSL hydrolase family protein [Spirochaetes bacterium]|nr:SGNH/GDSL hydrolase family protein [Spirochaetota bacterium]